MEKYKVYFCSLEIKASDLEKMGHDYSKALNDSLNRCADYPVDDYATFDTLEEAKAAFDAHECYLGVLTYHGKLNNIHFAELEKVIIDDEGDERAWETLSIKFPPRPQEEESEG